MTGVEAVVLDVNETLSDMSPMAERMADVGAPPSLAALWFAGVLRDGIGRTAAGAPVPFAEAAEGGLRAMLPGGPLTRPLDEAVAHVMAGLGALVVHPDVAPGIRALADAGLRVVTLSNGASATADRLLTAAGVRDRVEACLSVDDAGGWKPAGVAYAYAARMLGLAPERMLMVAVHPWDLDGAARAGLRTAWIRRGATAYPPHLAAPDVQAPGLDALAATLARST